MNDSRSIISVKEARKILGSKCSKLTDEQIEDIILKLYLIARGTIEKVSSIA